MFAPRRPADRGSRRRRRCRTVQFEPLECRASAAALFPSSLEQLFLDRLNALRVDLSPPGSSLRPFALDPEISAVVAQTNGITDADAIKALLRQNGVNFSEPNSIFALPLPGNSTVTATSPLTDPNAANQVVNEFLQEEANLEPTSVLIGRFGPGDDELRLHRTLGLDLDVVPLPGGGFSTSFAYITLAPADPSPILTGTVFEDGNNNGRFDLGEGLGGVEVQVPGFASTTTFDSGGFTLPVPILQSTEVEVVASGGGLAAPMIRNVPIEVRENTQVDFAVPGVGPGLEGSVALNNADFDGDGIDDFAVYAFNDAAGFGEFVIRNSSNGEINVTPFGGPNDQPVSGDFTGDGITDIAVYGFSPDDGFSRFAILPSDGGAAILQDFGGPSDFPAAGDFTGDGVADIAVFGFSPDNGFSRFAVLPSDGGSAFAVPFGGPNDQAVVGDFTGGARDDFAVFGFSPDNGFSRFAILPSDGGSAFAVPFGGPNDRPVAGDYDGGGLTDITVFGFSPDEGFARFAILSSEDGSARSVPFGGPDDAPVAGDFDGDGLTDIAVFGFSPANDFTRLAVQPSSGAEPFLLKFELPS